MKLQHLAHIVGHVAQGSFVDNVGQAEHLSSLISPSDFFGSQHLGFGLIAASELRLHSQDALHGKHIGKQWPVQAILSENDC